MARPQQLDILRGLVADPQHGPLPSLLLGLTAVTGVVDAVSILSLGRVFVANMTGNVVFIAFAVVGAAGFSLAASVSALIGFLLGAMLGGMAAERLRADRGRLFRGAVTVELLLLLAGVVALVLGGARLPGGVRDAVAGLIAVAMGLQNAVVRRLAVPDLTTTVLTMTLTGIASDLRVGRSVVARRALAVATMLGGAVVGALLTLHVSPAAALALAAGLMLAVTVGALAATHGDGAWRHPAMLH